jgi:hypothetical protein
MCSCKNKTPAKELVNMRKNEFERKFVPYIKRFFSPAQALEYVERCKRLGRSPKRILLGDHPEYWVVPATKAEALVKAGYEYLEIPGTE